MRTQATLHCVNGNSSLRGIYRHTYCSSLLLDSRTVPGLLNCILQCKIRLQLQSFGKTGVEQPCYEAIANHGLPKLFVIAVFSKGMEGCDERVYGLSRSLVETSTLVDWVSMLDKVVLEALLNCAILFSFLFRKSETHENVFRLLTHRIDESTNLNGFAAFKKAGCYSVPFKTFNPTRPPVRLSEVELFWR